MMNSLRAEPPAEGYSSVMVADDPQKLEYRLRQRSGIPLTEADIQNMGKFAKELKLNTPPLFNFSDGQEQ